MISRITSIFHQMIDIFFTKNIHFLRLTISLIFVFANDSVTKSSHIIPSYTHGPTHTHTYTPIHTHTHIYIYMCVFYWVQLFKFADEISHDCSYQIDLGEFWGVQLLCSDCLLIVCICLIQKALVNCNEELWNHSKNQCHRNR